MQSISLSKEKSFSFSQLMSGTLMVAGTTIGAGMLGMPLLTAKAGFLAGHWHYTACLGLYAGHRATSAGSVPSNAHRL